MESADIHERFARDAIALARQARRAGDHPFGALLVLDGEVVLTARNTVNTDGDPTAHAEANVAAAAVRQLEPGRIRQCVLYTSCEPCAMCVGKLYWAGIRSVVYALPCEELAVLAGRDFLVPCRELLARAVEPVDVVGPLLVDEARDVHVGFWTPRSDSERGDTSGTGTPAGARRADGDQDIAAHLAPLEDIRPWRDMYRLEMSCQIVHDSIHERAGWTHEYGLSIAGTSVGYGSIAIGGPWAGQPTVYEFHVVPVHRNRVFDLFRALLTASGAHRIEVQSNDVLAAVMLHTFAPGATSESILFRDMLRTSHRPPEATFREPTASEAPDAPAEMRRWRGVVEVRGSVAATGGILFHYNRPFADIYMEVAEPFRRRGVGSFLVQELKRVCHEGGHVPSARCNPANVASQRTLQKAGFVPCGHILKGLVAPRGAGSENPGGVSGVLSRPAG